MKLTVQVMIGQSVGLEHKLVQINRVECFCKIAGL